MPGQTSTALGLLTVGEAKKCKPRPSTTLASNTPTSAATPTSTPGPDAPDYYIDNPDFSLGLAYYTPSGNISWVGDDGYDGDGSSKDGTAQLTTNGNDDDNTDASPVQKRDLAGTSISATVKNLVASSPYTISFHYLVLTAKPDNSCRLRAYFNGNNFANTDRFPLTQKPSASWSLLSGTVTPSSTTGTFTISLSCNAPGFAVAYIDSLRVVKGAAVHYAFKHFGFFYHSFQCFLQYCSLFKHSGRFQCYPFKHLASSTSTPNATPTSSTLPSATVDSTVLILAKDAATAKLASDGLNAYGIPFQSFIVAQAGSTLPVLNSSLTSGNYGGIIVMSSVAYDYGGTTGWQSAITTDQWTALNNYQLSFNVRMVRIDEYPGASFGTTPGADGGCCTSPVTQNISFSDTSDFPTAQLKANVKVGTDGLYHVPATITDSSTTKAVAVFTPDSGSTVGGVAAVINNFNGREQFVWFISWATDWSQTSNWLQHAHIHWMTRGVFVGKRKVHLSDQIDDMQLSTEMFYPTNIPEVKIGITDLEAHVDWQTSINSRLPAGSDFWLEIGHNGNGDIINSTLTDDDMNTNKCNPPDAVYWEQDVQAPNEWRKPLGTGDDVWPTGTKYETYSWSLACAKIDQFALWFTKAANLNHFAHLSHTFSHMSLNNATYHDAKREIQFNQAWMKQMGIDTATRFTANGIIPPAITGLNNGDSIQALMENGIKHVVGDNTRPATRNPNSVYWPLISTYATNGYDGLTIIPRFSSRIYFNCHTPDCTTREWIQTSAGSGDFNTLLALEKTSSTRNLLALQSDPYMFHQANMYTTGNDIRTIGDQTRRMSLVMAWTETVVQEMIRLTNWPITSQTQDQMATYFTNRMTLDACSPKMSYVWSNDGKTLQKVVVTANGNTCSTPIPVTIPKGSVAASGGSVTSDVVGAEPPIQWVTLNGSPVTLTLSSAVTTTGTTSS
uniref:Extracellular serine-rich protein n=1 Tax=Bionectria ochroleuca TaxID=29856 RepID=A0A0B7KK46_BIOOC